jgi:hypothetical protein
MKLSTVHNLGSTLLLIVGMAGNHAAPAQGAEPAKQAGAEQKIPATAEGIWQSIDRQTAALDKVIRSGAMDEVHHHAFAIRDLAAALPERSKSLPADKLAQVNGSVKFVAMLAVRLDATGDAKDKAGAQANFGKLKKVLEGMRADYPKVTE